MATMQQSAGQGIDRIGLLPVLLLLVLGAASLAVGPEFLTIAIVGFAGAMAIAVRPQFGVALVLLFLMVQYGQRAVQREGVAGGVTGLLPQGAGFLTINNLLGFFLLALLVYRQYFERDWSFLKNRTFQLVLLVTAVQVYSAFVSGISSADQVAIGLQGTSAEDPSRVLMTRALFMGLFLFFIREPRDLRMILGLFLVLVVITAWTGSRAALTGIGGMGGARASAGRAGGLDVLIQSSKNPNRLALIASIGLVYVWEYGQAYQARRWLRWAALGVVLLMVVTVFLTASRGGLIGLVTLGIMLFVHQRGGSGRWLYAVAVLAVGAVLVEQVVPPESLDRITNIPGLSRADPNAPGAGSTERREYILQIALRIWAKAPIVGVGPGNWSYVRYLTDPARSVAVAHNSYLEALGEGGIMTLSLYLMLFYVTTRDLLRCERTPAIVARARAEGLDWMLVATRISMVGFLVFSVFSNLWDLIFAYFLLAVSAVLIQRYRPTQLAALPA